MKKVLYLLLLCLLASCATSRKGKLVWQENFSGNKIDNSVWSKISRKQTDWCNYMSDNDSCYDIRKGKLILRGIRNYSIPNDTAPYLTGGVSTKDKLYFTTGRIEIRALFDEATGAWPALWMLPKEAAWPKGGEIDIMEHLNHDSIAYQTLHSYYIDKLGNKTNPQYYSVGRIRHNNYNVYSVDIKTDSISFYINNKKTFAYPRLPEKQKEGQYVFVDQPFYLMLDMQLGGNWVGKVNPDELPVEMKIDWVRYYK